MKEFLFDTFWGVMEFIFIISLVAVPIGGACLIAALFAKASH